MTYQERFLGLCVSRTMDSITQILYSSLSTPAGKLISRCLKEHLNLGKFTLHTSTHEELQQQNLPPPEPGPIHRSLQPETNWGGLSSHSTTVGHQCRVKLLIHIYNVSILLKRSNQRNTILSVTSKNLTLPGWPTYSTGTRQKQNSSKTEHYLDLESWL